SPAAPPDPARRWHPLKVRLHDSAFVDSRAEELLALVAGDLEMELVPFDLGDARSDDDGAAGSRRRQVSHVHLVTDGGLTGRQQAFYRAMTGELHEPDHRRRGKRALAADVVRQKAAVDDTFGPALDARTDALQRVHWLDCPQ